MDLRWLEDAVVLLEESNMTRAAERRGVTQPAFSRRIKAFEDWLGVAVLRRQANRVDLEPAFRSNETEIRSLLDRLGELKKKIAHFDATQTTITIATQHSLIFSAFPDIAAYVRQSLPATNFRLRAGNQPDCISMFLRGDASALVCYERPGTDRLPFDDTVWRHVWGTDCLVLVVGDNLQHLVDEDLRVPDDIPALVFPEQSYFGQVLRDAGCQFATRSSANNPFCESAFAAGVRDMALKGMGVAWVPMSMCRQAIEDGHLVNLSDSYGSVPLEIALYAKTAGTLAEVWA